MNVNKQIATLGSVPIRLLQSTREITTLLVETVRGIGKGQYPRGEIFRQMYIMGNRSALLVCATMAFLAMIMVMQTGLQINRVTGDLSQLGPQFLRLFVQEFGPTITAIMMLATRVGAGIAAELGTMQVTEQVDALKLCGVIPTHYLVTPRFLACVVMTLVLTLIGVFTAFFAGGLTAWELFGLNPYVFFDASLVRPYDIGLGTCKAFSYGAAIPILSAHYGLRAIGGAQGVGAATTMAVIGSSLAILALDVLLSGAGFVLFSAT